MNPKYSNQHKVDLTVKYENVTEITKVDFFEFADIFFNPKYKDIWHCKLSNKAKMDNMWMFFNKYAVFNHQLALELSFSLNATTPDYLYVLYGGRGYPKWWYIKTAKQETENILSCIPQDELKNYIYEHNLTYKSVLEFSEMYPEITKLELLEYYNKRKIKSTTTKSKTNTNAKAKAKAKTKNKVK